MRATYEAWVSGDLSRWSAAVDPEIEWDATAYPVLDLPVRGRGREEYARVAAQYVSNWPGYEAAVVEVLGASNNKFVVVVHEKIRPMGFDVPMERDLFHVVTVQNRLVKLVRFYRTWDEALEAVGLSG